MIKKVFITLVFSLFLIENSYSKENFFEKFAFKWKKTPNNPIIATTIIEQNFKVLIKSLDKLLPIAKIIMPNISASLLITKLSNE